MALMCARIAGAHTCAHSDKRIGCLGPDFWVARYSLADIRLLEVRRNTNGRQTGIADCFFRASITHQTYRVPAIVEADGKRHDGWPIATSPGANEGHCTKRDLPEACRTYLISLHACNSRGSVRRRDIGILQQFVQ